MSRPRFLRDAGLIVGDSWEDARILRENGEVIPTEDLARFENGTSAFLFHLDSLSGPWPKKSWAGGWFGPFADEPTADGWYSGGSYGALIRWTKDGWIEVINDESYQYIGLGDWPGGRVITPDIRFTGTGMASRIGPGVTVPRFDQDPKIIVLEGEPSDDLPELERDPDLSPHAFTSLASGHAFLLYERRSSHELVVHRWSPGRRRPAETVIPGASALSRGIISQWGLDPTREILAVRPDEAYVFAQGRGPHGPYDTAIVRWNGSTWDVSFLSQHPFVTHARGPDGTIWLVYMKFDHAAPIGELWRKPPGGDFERVELPRAPMDGHLVEIAPADVWPRGADELWLIGMYNPRGEPQADTGLFLLDLPERAGDLPGGKVIRDLQ